MKIVNLSSRILLIGLILFAAGPAEKVLNSVEVYAHEKSNKNQMRGNHTTMEL
jgi:hypothetical protein